MIGIGQVVCNAEQAALLTGLTTKIIRSSVPGYCGSSLCIHVKERLTTTDTRTFDNDQDLTYILPPQGLSWVLVHLI